MPLPAAILPAVIASGSQLLGQGMNAISQGASNRKQRKWNEKMYGIQRADSLADWNMQNEYNSPAAQMARFRDAGLNPNLIYGQTQEASPVRQTTAQSWNPKAPTFDMGAVGQAGLSAYMDVQLKEAQVDNLKAQNDVLVQEVLAKAEQILASQTGRQKTYKEIEKLETDISTGKFNLGQQSTLAPIALEAAKLAVERQKSDIQINMNADERAQALNSATLAEAAERILRSRAERTNLEATRRKIYQEIENLKSDKTLKDLDVILKDQGIQPSDPAWMRILQQWLNKNDNQIKDPIRSRAKDIIRWDSLGKKGGKW